MKIAKKVLAVVIAVAMLGCGAMMAFASLAAETAQLELVVNGANKVNIYAKDCVGLSSADIIITYDASVLTKVRVSSGADSKNVNPDNFEFNSFTFENKSEEGSGEVKFGGYFKENLWSSERFAAEDLSGEANINGEYFHIATLNLTFAEGKTMDDVALDMEATVNFTNGLKDDEKVVEKIENFTCVDITLDVPDSTDPTDPTEPDSTDPTEPDSTDPTEPTEKPSGDDKPSGEDKPAGDIGLLAVAAGVVAVAGAAFVVSKKRK